MLASSRGGLIDLPPVRVSLVLTLRQTDDQPIERLADRDLAGEARIGPSKRGEAEHAGFLRTANRGAGGGKPRLIDIDVTGGAGAFAAAIRIDAGDVVRNRATHYRQPERHLD